MKQLLHIPSPKTKYLIKEIKINYGMCTARCYHACPPDAALFAAPCSQQSSSRTIPPGRGCTSTSHPIASHPIPSLGPRPWKIFSVCRRSGRQICELMRGVWQQMRSGLQEQRPEWFYFAVIISCEAIHKHKRGKASNKPESSYACILMIAGTLLSKKFKPSQRMWMMYFY